MDMTPAEIRAYYNRHDHRLHHERTDDERQLVIHIASRVLLRTKCHPCISPATHDRLLGNAVSYVVNTKRVFDGDEIVARAEKTILRYQRIFGDLAPERREREARLARKARAAAKRQAAALRSIMTKEAARARRQARLMIID